MSAGDWRGWASCLDSDPEVWFGEDHGAHRAAFAICAACPVQVECLRAALEAERGSGHKRWGIYGGLSPRDRVDIDRGNVRHGTRLGFRMHAVRGEEPCDQCWNARVRRRKPQVA